MSLNISYKNSSNEEKMRLHTMIEENNRLVQQTMNHENRIVTAPVDLKMFQE